MSEDAQKYWKEYKAKLILEDVFSFEALTKGESPDLQGNAVGIEVVDGFSRWYTESEGRKEKIPILLQRGNTAKANKRQKEADDIIQNAGPHVHLSKIQTPVGEVRVVSVHGDLYKSRKGIVLDTFSSKLERLNAGHFKNFPTMGVFITSDVMLSDRETQEKVHCSARKCSDLFQSMEQLALKWQRNYDFVIVYDEPEGLAVMYNFNDKSTSVRNVDSSKYDSQLRALCS